MKRLLFISGLVLIFLIACRGPLAKPEATANQSETKTDMSKPLGTSHMEQAKAVKEDIKIEPAQGSVTLAELFANKKTYEGKTVKVKGKVIKVNAEIMGKNWIHLQDGTGTAEEFDLTITSDFIPVAGNIIIVEGKIALNKDFGYGYAYPIIMEEGKLVVTQ